MDNNKQNTDKYKDIINLPHPDSKRHPRMSIINRAAQFAPFAALTGYDAAVSETARITEEKIELDENEKELLNEKLRLIRNSIEKGEKVEATITHFVKDDRKAGGHYFTDKVNIQKIDTNYQVIILQDKKQIELDNILDID